MESLSHRPSSYPPSSTNSSILQSWADILLQKDPSSDEGNQEEIIGDGTNIHRGPSNETKSCRNSKAFGPDKFSIFHLKHLGPRAIEFIATLFNLSVTTCQIPAIWKSSIFIPIPKPGKDTSQVTSYRPIALPSRKSPGFYAFTYNQQISPPCSRPTRFQT